MAANTDDARAADDRVDDQNLSNIVEDSPANINTLSPPHDESSSSGGVGSHINPVARNPTTTHTLETACGRLVQGTFTPQELPLLIEAVSPGKGENELFHRLSLENAKMLVDALCQMIDTPDFPPETRKGCLRLLYRTCGHYKIMPSALKVQANYDRTSDARYRGGYADVWKGECCGQEVAVKAIRVYSRDILTLITPKLCKEAVMWKFLQHPNILPLTGVTMSETRFEMVSEWMKNGNISEFIRKHPKADRIKLLVGATKGLIYLHDNGMIHGDLKGVNILVDEDGHARLADFGLLKIVSDPALNFVSSSSNTQGGTVRWMSPELIDPKMFGFEKSRLTIHSDCYALGMVIYETISGHIPFHGDTNITVSVGVIQGRRPTRGKMFPERLWKMMEWCWKPRPTDRPCISLVLRCLEVASIPPEQHSPLVYPSKGMVALHDSPGSLSASAVGVIQVVVRSARDIGNTKVGGVAPDPYVSLTLNDAAEVVKTKHQLNTYNPTWMETKFLLIASLHESLVLRVMDFSNDNLDDAFLGSASFSLAILEEDATQEDISCPIIRDSRECGELRLDVHFYPVGKSSEGTTQELAGTNVGIVKLALCEAEDLGNRRSTSGTRNAVVEVYLGNHPTLSVTSCRLDWGSGPMWQFPMWILCTDKKTSVVTIQVIGSGDVPNEPVVGYTSLRLADLLGANGHNDWWQLCGCNSGRIRLSTEWKPLELGLHGADQYVPPIGVVRLWLKKATDIRNIEATLGEKSDPYVRVLINGVAKARTEITNGDSNPVWDQVIYVPVHSLEEDLFLECLDDQHLVTGRSFGSAKLSLNGLAADADSEDYPYKATGKTVQVAHLEVGTGTFAGQLHYEAEFIPAFALKDFKFRVGNNHIRHAVARANSDSTNGNEASVPPSDIEGETVSVTLVPPRPPNEENKKNHTGNAGPTNSAPTEHDELDANPVIEPAHIEGERKPGKGAPVSKEELLQHQSGIIAFNITAAKLMRKARLEVFLDYAYRPTLTTPMARSRNVTWDCTSEGFIKELDFSHILLRLNVANEGTQDVIIGQWEGGTKEFLQEAMARPDGTVKRTLCDQDGKSIGTVDLEARYIPVPLKLEARESVNGHGVLRVQLLKAGGIRSVDRSSVFIIFTLNRKKVFESRVKKARYPEWDETFIVTVPSRVAADLQLEVFSSNKNEQAESLGSAKIDLVHTKLSHNIEKTIPFSRDTHGENGWVCMRLDFEPEVAVKPHSGTSKFPAADSATTGVGSSPFPEGEDAIPEVTHGPGRGRDGGSNRLSDDESVVDGVGNVSAEPGQGIYDAGRRGESGPITHGFVKVTILEARDYNPSGNDCKPYVILRYGDREYKTSHLPKSTDSECSWQNEQCTFRITSDQQKIQAGLYHYNTFVRDKLLAAGEIDISSHLNPDHGISSSEVLLLFGRGGGELKFQLEYSNEDPGPGPLGRVPRRIGSFSSVASDTSRKGSLFGSRSRKRTLLSGQ